jgi:hypothetical protein
MPQEQSPWYTPYRWLSVSQSRYGWFGEEENLLLLPGIESSSLRHPTHSLITILTDAQKSQNIMLTPTMLSMLQDSITTVCFQAICHSYIIAGTKDLLKTNTWYTIQYKVLRVWWINTTTRLIVYCIKQYTYTARHWSPHPKHYTDIWNEYYCTTHTKKY